MKKGQADFARLLLNKLNSCRLRLNRECYAGGSLSARRNLAEGFVDTLYLLETYLSTHETETDLRGTAACELRRIHGRFHTDVPRRLRRRLGKLIRRLDPARQTTIF